jgi:hypothetical protein
MIMIIPIAINMSSTLIKSILLIHYIISRFRPHHRIKYIHFIVICSLS